MGNSRIRTSMVILSMLNILIVSSFFTAGWILYYNKIITWSYQYKGNLAMSTLFLILYFLLVKVYDAFEISARRKMDLIISQVLSAFFADAMMYVIICFLYEWLAPVWPLILAFAFQSLCISLWVILSRNWYYACTPVTRAVILYDRTGDVEHLKREMACDKNYELVAVVDILDCVENDMKPLDDADVVFICTDYCSERDAVIEYCIARKYDFFIVPSINDMLINSARHVHMFHMPIMQIHMGEVSLGYLFVKRIMDIVLSSIALLVLWPLILIIAIAIKAYDGGPAFYKQVRLTKGGKEFELIKLRSMRIDAEADGVARLSTGDNDDRITPIGKWIRKFRFDELPQLINIFRGDMSIVGPRPERPEIAEKYEQELPEFRMRLQAKAGLTGYAQVYGKYNSSPREKLFMDMIYISRPSIIEDIRLIFATFRVLLMKESTEGVESQFVSSYEIK